MDPLHARPWQLGARWRRGFDLLLVGGLVVLGVLGHVAAGQLGSAVLTGIQAGPLAFRRTRPWPVFLVIAAASVVQAVLVDFPIVGQLAFPIAVYSVARWARRWQGVVALLVGYAGAVVATLRWITAFDGDITPGTFTPYLVTIAAIVTTAWALGFAGQQREGYVAALVGRAEQAERMAEREVQLAAQDERARIAREMHDVVAHGLSVIVVQADGAGYASAKDPEVAVETLARIGATGRESLTEMRRLLGLLRGGDSGVRPQPGLADVTHLVTDARATGARVDADLPEPWPTVPEGAGLAAYRIVQEALTNVRKHAGPDAEVTVRVGVEAGAIAIEVLDDGRGGAAASDGAGLGMLGMRERAAARGGTLEAGPAPGGGFAVSARIPL